jgi:hypothetical protein
VVLEWPENNFRKEYARLGELRRTLPGVPLLALSATPTPSMWEVCAAAPGLSAISAMRPGEAISLDDTLMTPRWHLGGTFWHLDGTLVALRWHLDGTLMTP